MTLNAVKQRVEEIRKLSCVPENQRTIQDARCYELEATLYMDILRCAAKGQQVRELARAALETRGMNFSRWIC